MVGLICTCNNLAATADGRRGAVRFMGKLAQDFGRAGRLNGDLLKDSRDADFRLVLAFRVDGSDNLPLIINPGDAVKTNNGHMEQRGGACWDC